MDIIRFAGSMRLLLCITGNIYLGFQSRGGSPCLHALLPAYNGFLRFTSGVTPADLLVLSTVAEPFQFTYTCKSIGGAQVRIECTSQHVTRQTLYQRSSAIGVFPKCFAEFRIPEFADFITFLSLISASKGQKLTI